MRGFVSALRTITHNLTCSCAPVLGGQRPRGFVCMSSQRPPLQCASPESAAAQSGWIADCGRVPVGGARLGGNGLGGGGTHSSVGRREPRRRRGGGLLAGPRARCRCREEGQRSMPMSGSSPSSPAAAAGEMAAAEKRGGIGRSSAKGRWPSPMNTNE